jgi:hypothetical protein
MKRASQQSTGELPRVLGVRDAGRRGPLVLIVAGQHGNEARGIDAARELLAELPELDSDGRAVHGRIVVLSGNRAALKRGVRHQGKDLNRLWTAGEVAALATRPAASDGPDEAELRELHAALMGEITARGWAADAASREVILVDLHSTSAGGGGFTIVADSIPSRALACAVPLPVILGLEERLEGPLLTWMAQQAHTAVVLEGGQHDDPLTTRTCVAALWLMLAKAEVVGHDHPRIEPARAFLERVSHGLPPVMDLSYVHPVQPGDTYVMEPGWRNFMRVCRDQSLALQNGDVVQAPLDGYMLMPLYQGLGKEGYFLCRPVSHAWITLSRLARRSRLELVLRLAPGVRALDLRQGLCRTRRRLSRLVVGALHLFGYRKCVLTSADEALWHRKPQ